MLFVMFCTHQPLLKKSRFFCVRGGRRHRARPHTRATDVAGPFEGYKGVPPYTRRPQGGSRRGDLLHTKPL